MPSPVEICRLALSHIADPARITSIDPPDGSLQAQHCATFYPIARDECLEAYDWPFAVRRAELAQSLVAVPEANWQYTYIVPAGYLRAIKVVAPDAREDAPSADFKIEMDTTEQDYVLLTNVPNAVLHYVYREEETGRYSPTFVSALSFLLAAYLAGPILKGKVGVTVAQSMYQAYRAQLPSAAARQLNAKQDSTAYADHKPTWVTDR